MALNLSVPDSGCRVTPGDPAGSGTYPWKGGVVLVRDYELVFIIKPDVGDENTEGVIERVKQYIANANGEITKVEPWGLRKLAYPISDFREGYYVVMQFRMDPKATAELERSIRLTEDIIRHLLVRLGE